jgi:hypothetical protein
LALALGKDEYERYPFSSPIVPFWDKIAS